MHLLINSPTANVWRGHRADHCPEAMWTQLARCSGSFRQPRAHTTLLCAEASGVRFIVDVCPSHTHATSYERSERRSTNSGRSCLLRKLIGGYAA